MSGKYYDYNVTLGGNYSDNLEAQKLVTGGILPNGLYRFVIKFWTKDDPDLYNLNWIASQNVRIGEDGF
jgi:hypothetical protein